MACFFHFLFSRIKLRWSCSVCLCSVLIPFRCTCRAGNKPVWRTGNGSLERIIARAVYCTPTGGGGREGRGGPDINFVRIVLLRCTWSLWPGNSNTVRLQLHKCVGVFRFPGNIPYPVYTFVRRIFSNFDSDRCPQNTLLGKTSSVARPEIRLSFLADVRLGRTCTDESLPVYSNTNWPLRGKPPNTLWDIILCCDIVITVLVAAKIYSWLSIIIDSCIDRISWK